MRIYYLKATFLMTALSFFISARAQQIDLLPLTEKGNRFGQTRVEQRRFPQIERELAKMEEDGIILKDDSLQAYMQEILDTLLPAELGEIPIRIVVLKSPVVNAGMYMNGVLLLHTGLLAELDNKAQLAFVICHELAHLVLRHPLMEYYDSKGPEGVHRYPRLSLSRIKNAIRVYPDKLEAEADSLAWELFMESPYSWPEAAAVMDKLPEMDSIKHNFFLRVLKFLPDIPAHPQSEARRAFIKKRLADTTAPEGVLGETDYLVRTKNLPMFNISLLPFKGANYTTLSLLDTLQQMLSDTSSRYYREVKLTQGEVYAEMLSNPRKTGLVIYTHQQQLGKTIIPVIGSEEAIRLFKEAKPDLEKEALAALLPFIEDPHLGYRVHRALGLIAFGDKNYEEARKHLGRYLQSGKKIYDQEFMDSLFEKMERSK